MTLLDSIADALKAGDDRRVTELTTRAIADGVPAPVILNDGLVAGMAVVGERFRKHDIFLPDVLLAARAMNAGTALLEPLFVGDERPTMGKVVVGTVKGDLHDIGKNLVGIMLRGAGFQVVDLGKDVAPSRFVEAARDEAAHVVGMSALLTTTVPGMSEVTALLASEELPHPVRTIVGGAPMSPALAREVGADAFGFDAMNAVDRVKDLVGR